MRAGAAGGLQAEGSKVNADDAQEWALENNERTYTCGKLINRVFVVLREWKQVNVVGFGTTLNEAAKDALRKVNHGRTTRRPDDA